MKGAMKYSISMAVTINEVRGYNTDYVAKFESSLEVPEAALGAIEGKHLESLYELIKPCLKDIIARRVSEVAAERLGAPEPEDAQTPKKK